MGNASSKSNEKNPQPIKFNRINTFDKNDQEEKEEVFGTLEERQKKHLEMINLAKDVSITKIELYSLQSIQRYIDSFIFKYS